MPGQVQTPRDLPMFTLFQPQEIGDDDRHLRDTAKAVAAAMCEQLGTATANMTRSELRGYIRARMQHMIRTCAAEAVAGRASAFDGKLADKVMDYTVQLVVDQQCAPPIVAIPAPHVLARRAA